MNNILFLTRNTFSFSVHEAWVCNTKNKQTNKKLAQCQTREVSMNELHGIVNYCCFAFIYPFKGMNQKTNDCKYFLAIRDISGRM